MATLQRESPHLANDVVEERLAIGQAWAAYQDKLREQEDRRKRTTEDFSRTVTALWSHPSCRERAATAPSTRATGYDDVPRATFGAITPQQPAPGNRRALRRGGCGCHGAGVGRKSRPTPTAVRR